MFLSSDNFRANIVLDTKECWSEDDYFELRIGPVFMRFVGPCVRCTTIMTNWDKFCRVDEGEPYRTLSTFRTCPGLGVLFGSYYQMETITNSHLYSEVLPSELGYPSF